MLLEENGVREPGEIRQLLLSQWSKARVLAFAVGVLACAAVPTQGAPSAAGATETPPAAKTPSKEITPPHVYAKVQLVRRELELIRVEMGRPKANALSLRVTGAASREVFFQALTMHKKASRLSFDVIRKRFSPPEAPQDNITPGHVFMAVDSTLKVLREIKVRLGIEETVIAPPRDETLTPTDVFNAILSADRQLNLMLAQRFSPSDVFQQVTVAVGYVSRVLATFPGANRAIEEPAYERRKFPHNVYFRLLKNFERVSRLARSAGISVLSVDVSAVPADFISPSDVYDVASLLVSELHTLHRTLQISEAPRQAYFPGLKFPSDVYQRVGLLEAQLVKLESLASVSPLAARGRQK